MLESSPKIILVDDEEDFRHALKQSLILAGYEVEDYASSELVLSEISTNSYAVVVSDIRMPDMDGMSLLAKLLEVDSALPVVLVTGHGNVSTAVEAMRNGAYDFIEKPFSIDRLTNVVSRGLEKRRLVLENRLLREQLSGEDELVKNIVGNVPAMRNLKTKIKALSDTDVDILLWGETGSGKEVVARALHEEGARKDQPFVALNCGAIPLEMMESELFGHESGAFTSANKRRIGKLEYAEGGTVFLDEIESMPMELQIKLLRVIETRTIERLGSNTQIPLNVRFVAATKIDLEEASNKGLFRKDLYYRLNVVVVNIPPLRERKDDIPALCHFFLVQARARYRQDSIEMDSSVLAQFMMHDWPGNVRELRNAIDRLVLGMWTGFDGTPVMSDIAEGATLGLKMSNYESMVIKTELENNQGSIKKTYEGLGISRKALYDKMQKYGLSKKED